MQFSFEEVVDAASLKGLYQNVIPAAIMMS